MLKPPSTDTPLPPSSNGLLFVADTSLGLPSNQIHKIGQDRFARLWLASPAGLSCFDGSFVQAYDRRNGLQCAGLRSVGIDSEGIVWVGTDLGLEALDEQGLPLPWTAWFAWPFGLCEHLVTFDKDVWVGSAQGLVRISSVRDAPSPEIVFHVPLGFIRHITCLAHEHLYVASDTLGLVEVEGTSWWQVKSADLMKRRITRLALGPDDHLFVGTDSGVLVLDRATKKAIAPINFPFGQKEVTALVASQEELWVAFGRTLAVFSYATWAAGAQEIYHLGSRINDLSVDALDNVWIATDTSGLAMVSCLRHCLKRIHIGQDGAVFSIKPEAENRYVLGGENLLCSVALPPDQPPVSRPGPAGLPETIVWDTYADQAGLWAATHAGLYHGSPGSTLLRVFEKVPVLGGPARVILPRGNEIFVGTLLGLARIVDGQAEEVRPIDGQPFGYVYALYLDDEARLWVATLGRGLWRENEQQQFVPVVGGPLSQRGNTYAVAHRPGSDTIVLQDEKVILLDHKLSARLLREFHPVAGWTCLWLEPERVAIGSSNGLYMLDITTGNVTLSVASLIRLRDWEFTNNRTLVRDSQGRLLCGLTGGLIQLDLTQLRRFLTPPSVRLADIHWRGTSPKQEGIRYRAYPGVWSFQVRAFSAWFVDHGTLRYRFKLVGFDDVWSPLQTQPTIAYNSLPPGHYEVHAQAHSPLTGFGPPATLCEIVIARPWWTAGWAPALAAIEAAYNQLVRSHLRNQMLLDRSQELEQEVVERTAALRATNQELQRARLEMENLSLIDALTQIPNRRYLDLQLTKEIARCQRQQVPLSVLILDVDFFKTINDQLGHNVGDDYLRAVAGVIRSQVREDIDACARYGGEEFVVLMPATRRSQALVLAERIRAAVEALNLPNGASPYGHVTISGGIDTLEPQTRGAEADFLSRADQALYAAKRQGRNQIATSAASGAGVASDH